MKGSQNLSHNMRLAFSNMHSEAAAHPAAIGKIVLFNENSFLWGRTVFVIDPKHETWQSAVRAELAFLFGDSSLTRTDEPSYMQRLRRPDLAFDAV